MRESTPADIRSWAGMLAGGEGPAENIFFSEVLALGQSHRIRCPADIRCPCEVSQAKPEQGPWELLTPFLFSQLAPGTATPLLQNPANSGKAQMLLDVGVIQGWKKEGINYKARNIRTKPHSEGQNLFGSYQKIKPLVTKTSRKTKGWRWSRF